MKVTPSIYLCNIVSYSSRTINIKKNCKINIYNPFFDLNFDYLSSIICIFQKMQKELLSIIFALRKFNLNILSKVNNRPFRPNSKYVITNYKFK